MDRRESGLYNEPVLKIRNRTLFAWVLAAAVGVAAPGILRAADVYREGWVQVPSATVWSSPDTSYFPLAKLLRGTSVKVYGKQGSRLFVHYEANLERREGWVDEAAIYVRDLIRPPDQVAGRKVFPGRVVAQSAEAYEGPGGRGKILAHFQEGDPLQIISQSQGWYRVRLEFLDGSVGSGWVEKDRAELGAAEPVSPSGEVESPPEPAANEMRGLRFLLTPVLDVYRFGTTQFRLGAAYDFALNPWLSLGVPVTYSMSGLFASLQAGVDVWFRLMRWRSWAVYERTGVFFERFSGQGASFLALTADVGIGLQYEIFPGLALLLEPVSFEITPYNSGDVPWFVRAQLITSVRYQW